MESVTKMRIRKYANILADRVKERSDIGHLGNYEIFCIMPEFSKENISLGINAIEDQRLTMILGTYTKRFCI